MERKYQEFVDILKVILPIYKNNQKKVHLKKILVITIRMLEYISPRTSSKKAQILANRKGLGQLEDYIWEHQKR
jgi:hypothetical protein